VGWAFCGFAEFDAGAVSPLGAEVVEPPPLPVR
jgi:hypothetical protein